MPHLTRKPTDGLKFCHRVRLDHGERNALRARSQQTEWTCIISLSLVQFASMSCNSADLHSCAFQDRLWMNEWRECWTDANFSGSARIEDRAGGAGRAAASDAPKKIYSPFFTHFVYSLSFSLICSLFTCFLTLSVASFSPLCQLSHPPWQQCFHWTLQKKAGS